MEIKVKLTYLKAKFNFLKNTFVCIPIVSIGSVLNYVKIEIFMSNVNGHVNFYLINNQGFILSNGKLPIAYCSRGIKVNCKNYLNPGLFYLLLSTTIDIESFTLDSDKSIFIISKNLNVTHAKIKFETNFSMPKKDHCVYNALPLLGKIILKDKNQFNLFKKQFPSVLFWNAKNKHVTKTPTGSGDEKFIISSLINSQKEMYNQILDLKSSIIAGEAILKKSSIKVNPTIILPIHDKQFEENIMNFLIQFKISFDVKLVLVQHGIKLKSSNVNKLKNTFKNVEFIYFPKKVIIGSVWHFVLKKFFKEIIIKLDCDDLYKPNYIQKLIETYFSKSEIELGGYSGSLVEDMVNKRLFIKTRLTSYNASKLLGGTLIFNNKNNLLVELLDGKEKEIDRIIEKNISKSEDFGTSLDYIYRRQTGSLWKAKASWLNQSTDVTFFESEFK